MKFADYTKLGSVNGKRGGSVYHEMDGLHTRSQQNWVTYILGLITRTSALSWKCQRQRPRCIYLFVVHSHPVVKKANVILRSSKI